MIRSPTLLENTDILYLPLGSIAANPMQPRKIFSSEALEELSESIRQYGVLQPLSVRRTRFGYELICGERRLRAAQMAGLCEVPCIVVDTAEEISGLLALVENLQRCDLDCFEEAAGLAELMGRFHLSQQQTARRVGKSQSAVANKLRLLRLSDETVRLLRQYDLTERHARALLRLPNAQMQLSVCQRAGIGGWSVAKTEQYIDSLLKPPGPKRELGIFHLRDTRAFFNTVRHHLKQVQAAGIGAESEQIETEKEIILTIRIQKT